MTVALGRVSPNTPPPPPHLHTHTSWDFSPRQYLFDRQRQLGVKGVWCVNKRLNREGHCGQLVGWVLLYVHRNRRLIRDGSPRRPPRLSHSSWALIVGRAAPQLLESRTEKPGAVLTRVRLSAWVPAVGGPQGIFSQCRPSYGGGIHTVCAPNVKTWPFLTWLLNCKIIRYWTGKPNGKWKYYVFSHKCLRLGIIFSS